MEKEIDNPGGFVKYNVQFHLTIVRVSKNLILPIFSNSVRESFLGEREGVARLLDVSEGLLKYHKRIREAIKDRNVDKALEEMANHLNSVEGAILRYLSK